MGVAVALSTVADGSMHNRRDPLDPVVIANRERWLGSQGIQLDATTRLLISYDGDNFCRYKEVGAAEQGINMRGDDGFVADALVTRTPGHVLFLPVADCVATVLYDPEHEVLMLTHLGRQSLEQQGAQRSVEHLTRMYGSRPEALQVWLSPTINKDAYPIFSLDNKGMKEALYEQLAQAGVRSGQVTDNDADTGTNDNYYSYSEYLKGNKPEDGCHAVVAVLDSMVD